MGWHETAIGLRGAAGALCALVGAVSTSAQPAKAAASVEIPHTQPPASEAERLLSAHNAERMRLGLPPLEWSPELARGAAEHAQVLAARGVMEHADGAVRKGRGENLWLGTAGAWNVEGMIGMFLDERRNFRHAAFPHISTTGQWKDVGHYSQIVWRETKQVGCAVESGSGLDVLVCRYYPAGNVIGQSPY